MSQTIFYSWQSDTRAACNRSLIQDALTGAIAELRGIQAASLDVVIDRDTIGTPGSPDIASTILEKIDRCSAMIADVTLVDGAFELRRFPNPNVLLEVGYAIKAKSFARIILVMNTHFGAVEQLPFDLRGKRVLTYTSAPEAESRAPTRNLLKSGLVSALVETLRIDAEADSTSTFTDIDVPAVRAEIESLLTSNSSDAAEGLKEILQRLDQSRTLAPSDYSLLLDVAVTLASRRRVISDAELLSICDRAIARHPTSTSHFNRGMLAGRMGLPFDSIAGYMKAISLDDPNPSLCYLNAGNRYRDMNDRAIARSFYDKAVALNPLQADAWLSAAQVARGDNDTPSAIRYYEGFLRWFEALPEHQRREPRLQQAEVARAYIREYTRSAVSTPSIDA
jgi:tetratricopeptide (TPR) repeat protein